MIYSFDDGGVFSAKKNTYYYKYATKNLENFKTNNSSTVILHNIRKIVNAKSKKGKKKHAIYLVRKKSINAVKTLPKIGQFSINILRPFGLDDTSYTYTIHHRPSL